ncbi:c-type cytochrome [Pseudomonas sp. V1]|uniref:c-type cytochrome n=1 Tax=Pseudomonas arcuscaelestis TaxID=2710591 RepID=UPI00193F8578|nr:c-type cytochrome [Pseudomonas arcuscaelestis]MBM3104066.1 c-type cytochrome [Pseudomonas arcuscaelestis]
MHSVKMAAALLVLAAGLADMAWAQDQAPREATPCFACHGERGEGTALGPKLAGLSAQYIDTQIDHYISGQRSNPLMTPMAQAYTDPLLRKPVATYFASQGKLPELYVRGQHQAGSAAERLYYQGDTTRGIPACYSCHGPSGVGGGPFPRLAGQQADYVSAQLLAWQKDERKGDPGNMMAVIAKRLSAEDVQALASYLAEIR